MEPAVNLTVVGSPIHGRHRDDTIPLVRGAAHEQLQMIVRECRGKADGDCTVRHAICRPSVIDREWVIRIDIREIHLPLPVLELVSIDRVVSVVTHQPVISNGKGGESAHGLEPAGRAASPVA